MTKKMGSFVLALIALYPLVGCDSSQSEAPKEQPAAARNNGGADTSNATAEAEKLFVTRCAQCHGMDGKGDGPGAANLNPKPRNYHDKTWQASVTDEQIEKTILYGGAAVGKNANMPGNPDLTDKPAVLAALRQYIRDFGK